MIYVNFEIKISQKKHLKLKFDLKDNRLLNSTNFEFLR